MLSFLSQVLDDYISSAINNDGRKLEEQLLDASKTGNVNEVNKLVRRKVNVNYQNEDGYAAIHYAAIHSLRSEANMPVILISAGADVNLKHNKGWTALHFAAITGNVPVVTNLILSGAKVNAQTNDGYTALHCACAEGHFEVVACLINACIDINIPNKDGKLALQIAFENDKQSIIDLINNVLEINSKRGSISSQINTLQQKIHLLLENLHEEKEHNGIKERELANYRVRVNQLEFQIERYNELAAKAIIQERTIVQLQNRLRTREIQSLQVSSQQRRINQLEQELRQRYIQSNQLVSQQRRISQLEEQLRENNRITSNNISNTEDEFLCVVCIGNRKNVLFLPCRHLSVCESCASHNSVSQCPMCRRNISSKTIVYT